MSDLRQILAQGRKRLGIFIGAGGPADLLVDTVTKKMDPKGEALIPTIHKLTEVVLASLDPKYEKAIKSVKANLGPTTPNIEAILSRIRSLGSVLGADTVCDVDGAGYQSLAGAICKAIGEIVQVSLPVEPNPYAELAAWVGGASREHPVEIFTTNYDLLIEEALERTNLPYFDGFVGAHRAFFDAASVASNDLPARWTRVWKLHGSLGWELNSSQEVIRTGSRSSTNLIYPDHLKYDQTRKLPYSALLDRLKQFLCGSDTLLIATGFSFSDTHISTCISECLSANPSASVFAFQYRKLEEETSVCKLGFQRANLSVYAPDGAVINGIAGAWRLGELPAPNWESIREDFRVCWLDPWDLSRTGQTWSYNFLNVLTPESRNLADDARALADAIIIPGSKTETHWDDSAKILLAGILIYAAIHPHESRRDLTRVCEILMLPWDGPKGADTLSAVLGRMVEMEDSSTLANSVGHQYLGMPEKERESIFSAARRDSVWVKSPPMWRVLKDNGKAIDLDRVAAERYMLFVVLPFERLRTHRAWLRLLVTALAERFRRIPARGPGFAYRRHVFVDEWPRLGKLEIFEDEIAVARGADVQYHFYCQSFGQVEANYKDTWEDFIANSAVQAFAIQDKKTSEYLSALTGMQTIENPSWSRQRGFRGGRSSQSYGFTGRAVMMPDEIRRMKGSQLVIARGLNPILADVERVYLSPRFRKAEAVTLAEVAATVGRQAASSAERARFAWWDAQA
jgi:Type IV secretory system Conjugative DNA transfer/SIR2-like domain